MSYSDLVRSLVSEITPQQATHTWDLPIDRRITCESSAPGPAADYWYKYHIYKYSLTRLVIFLKDFYLGNQVAQNVRASTVPPSLEAMHAGAAAHHGQMSACIAVLSLASGAGSFHADGRLMVTAEHVQARDDLSPIVISPHISLEVA